MAHIQFEQTNLIGGVSQQPPSVRLPNQAKELVNMWPSPVDGLVRRLPTEYQGILEDDPGSLTKYHTIYRDNEEQYLLVLNSSGINAYNLQDPTATVTITDTDIIGYSYLGVTDAEQIQVLTVQDTTFILNTGQSTAANLGMDTPVTPSMTGEALVFLKQANYLTRYGITINYTVSAVPSTYNRVVTTWNGSTGAGGDILPWINTDQIISEPAGPFNGIMERLDAAIGTTGTAEFTFEAVGSVLRIIPAVGVVITSVECTDGLGDAVFVPVFEKVPRVEGYLPETAPHGFLVEVVVDAEVDQDNYWVTFVTDEGSGFGPGTWQEAAAPGITTTIDPAFMPHVLVNTGLNTFTWERADWGTRTVGDEDTNEVPSFIDQGLNGMFFYKDRLGLLSGPNVIMSEVGEYYNFFRVSVLSFRDSDRIDIAASHTKVANFRSVAPSNGNMVLFTDRSQFILKSDDILSPRTVELLPASEYEASTRAIPVSTARSVFFPFKRGDQSGIRELYQMGDSYQYDAADTTIQVPKYIQGGVEELAASSLEDVLLVLTDSPTNLYGYKYMWSGNERSQSAWFRWNFNDDEVRHMAIVESDVYLVISRLKADGVTQELHLEKLSIATGLSDDSATPPVYLDRRMLRRPGGAAGTTPGVTAVFGGVNTVITIPWHVGTADYAVLNGNTQEEYEVVSAAGTTITVVGDVTNKTIVIGQLYESLADFSHPLIKYRSNGNGGLTARYGDPQHVRAGYIQFNATKTFLVDVTVNKRTTRTMTFTGLYSEELANGLFNGEFAVGVSAMAPDVSFVIRNATPYQSNLSSITWETLYKPRGSKFRG